MRDPLPEPPPGPSPAEPVLAEPAPAEPTAAEPAPVEPAPVEPTAAEPTAADLDDGTVADIATNMWRVMKRFSGDGEVSKAQRMAMRNLTAMSERLDAAGIRVQDHDGTPWDPGMSLKAIAYEPRPNVEQETVVETVRPTVYRGGQCIQFGHVIVGVPEKGQDSGTGEH